VEFLEISSFYLYALSSATMTEVEIAPHFGAELKVNTFEKSSKQKQIWLIAAERMDSNLSMLG
jgi:hypothetical protein